MILQEIPCIREGVEQAEKFAQQSEIKTTADPAAYNLFHIVEIENDICVLENGSRWRFNSPSISQGDPIQLIDRNTMKNKRTGHCFEAKLLDLPASDRNVIEKIQWVHWAGEQQALITLRDGSQWFFDEFAYGVNSWKAGDRVLLFQCDPHREGLRNDLYYMSDMDREGPVVGGMLGILSTAYGRLAEYSLRQDRDQYVIRDW